MKRTYEVLALCAVVGTLGVSLFPPLLRARESESASDINRTHLKSLWMASMQYARDHDNRFMPMNYWNTNTYWWGRTSGNIPYSTPATGCDFSKGILTPYLPRRGVLFSPAFAIGRRPASPGVAFGYNYRFVGGNFGIESPETQKNAQPARLADIANASRTILFSDSVRWNHFDKKGQAYLEENPFLSPPYPDQYPTFHARHNGYGHVLFVDGSIQAFKPLKGVRSKAVQNAPAELGHLPQEWFDRE